MKSHKKLKLHQKYEIAPSGLLYRSCTLFISLVIAWYFKNISTNSLAMLFCAINWEDADQPIIAKYETFREDIKSSGKPSIFS